MFIKLHKIIIKIIDIDLYGCQNRQDLPSVCAAIQEPFMQHVMYMCTIKFPHWDKVTCCIDWIFHILCSVQEYAMHCTDKKNIYIDKY